MTGTLIPKADCRKRWEYKKWGIDGGKESYENE